MIAAVASFVGNSILKVPLLAVLSPPNAIAQTALVVPVLVPVVELYIKAAFAVKEAEEKVSDNKETAALSDSEGQAEVAVKTDAVSDSDGEEE